MTAGAHERGDFIPYPSQRVVGTIRDPVDARRAIEALLAAGFGQDDIDILHGEQDVHRLDPTGAEHGFLAQFQRTMIRVAGPVEEFAHLSQHVADVRAGKFVIMVLAREPVRRHRAAEILNAHGAESVGFFGTWAYEALGPATSEGDAAGRPTAGRTYEVELAGVRTRIRFDSDASATVSDPQAPSSSVAAIVTAVRPRVLMLSWTAADGRPVFQVQDFERGAAFGTINSADGRLAHAAGTVRPID